MSDTVTIECRAGRVWDVVSPWGSTTWSSWDDAVAFAKKLEESVKAGVRKAVERAAEEQEVCAYSHCPRIGSPRFGYGRGFCFCDEHAAHAEKVFARSPTRAGIDPRAAPKIRPLTDKQRKELTA